MFPHVFGAAAEDSKAVGRTDELELLLQRVIRRIQSCNVLAAGMSGFQQGNTSQRRSTRLENKKGEIIVQDLPRPRSNKEWQTSPRSDGDVIVLSLDEHSPTHVNPREAAGAVFTDEREVTDTEPGEVPPIPMAPSTRLKCSSFRGDGSQDADDWFCEFESIAGANQEDPDSKKQNFQGLLKGEVLKWYQDVLDEIREDWTDFTLLFLKTFREAGGEAHALGRLSQMTKKPLESVRKYG